MGKDLAGNVLRLQEERASAYSELKSAHKSYLESGLAANGGAYDFDKYKVSVDESTKVFSRVSQEVMQIKKKCEEEEK